MVFKPEQPCVEPSFTTPADAESAIVSFNTEHTVPECRNLIALGYGPLGIHDPNYSPAYRRRYYTNREKLLGLLNELCDREEAIRDVKHKNYREMREKLDHLINDIKWYITSRADVRVSSEHLD